MPLLQSLLENPQRLFGLILTPTRELAFQIGEQIEALGKFKTHTDFSLFYMKFTIPQVLVLVSSVLL